MVNFAQKVCTYQVPAGAVGVFFLGQAGFIFKTPMGQMAAVDPYLSDCCERYFGFKRLMPHILEAGELTLDQLIISHAHYDHFDPDSVPLLMANGHTELIGAQDTRAECQRLNLEKNVTYLSIGETVIRGEISVKGMPCDHGELAPDALGLLITVGEKKIYLMGDTAYRPDLLENEEIQGVNLLILPINGAFGNLNEEQAARVIHRLQPRMAVPCHYWNFAEHGGNPGLFQEKMREIAPEIPYVLMRQGEGMMI
ncbi:MAG: MBL fold metallo-hydrolase [Clostridiales bacterium]|nr:MBL fold metallo-hydrolase [Clostridiales bacterium]